MTVWWAMLAACTSPPDVSFVAGCDLDVAAAGGEGAVVEQAEPGCAGLELVEVTVEGDGEHRVEWFVGEDFVLPSVAGDSPDATVRSVRLSGRWGVRGGGSAERWRLPWHSTSPGQIEELPATADPGFAGSDDSWWGSMVQGGDGAALVGALSAASSQLAVSFGADGSLEVVWEVGEVELGEGGFVYLDPMMLAVGPEAEEVWARWLQSVGAQKTRRPPALPVAWRGSAAGLPSALETMAWSTFVVDSPSEQAVADIVAAGARAGTTFRPLEVPVGDPVVQDEPGWFLREPDGSLRIVDGHHVLDVLASGASDVVEEAVRARVEQGYDYLRVEGLAEAARPSLRAEALPDAEAFALTMSAVERGAQGALVVVDGPWLPSLGQGDGLIGGPASPQDRFLKAGAVHAWSEAGVVGSGDLDVAMAVVGGGGVFGDVVLDAAMADARLATPVEGSRQGAILRWVLSNGWEVVVNAGDAPQSYDAPSATSALTGEVWGGGTRELLPGAADAWLGLATR